VLPDPAELRVLGCLIEKQRTTPDAYPLTLNSLRLACNQSTNRDPVVDYDEHMIRGALDRLGARGWVRLATWSDRRTKKYRHLFGDALNLSAAEQALLCLLMLRGAQTPAELRQRSERLYSFGSGEEVDEVLADLGERGLVAEAPHEPGRRGQRFTQVLDGGEGKEAPAPTAGTSESAVAARVSVLEEGLGELRRDLDALRRELGAG
jgi:uncharacterized protein YceH (UPF0502 family)